MCIVLVLLAGEVGGRASRVDSSLLHCLLVGFRDVGGAFWTQLFFCSVPARLSCPVPLSSPLSSKVSNFEIPAANS